MAQPSAGSRRPRSSGAARRAPRGTARPAPMARARPSASARRARRATSGTSPPWTITETQHDDEDHAYTCRLRRHRCGEHEGAQQDRDGALEPGPEHEHPLARRSRTGSSSGPTSSGRITNASSSASTSPIHTPLPCEERPPIDGEPSTMKATISARLARAQWKRSISRLYGARTSPTRMPATKHGEEPGAVREASPRRRARSARPGPQRIQRLARQRDPAHEPAQQPAAGDADDAARSPSAARTAQRRRPTAPPAGCPAREQARPSARCRPGRWRRTRPPAWCPRGRRPPAAPSTENTTAGSVGRERGHRSAGRQPVKPKQQCAPAPRGPPAVTNVPTTPIQTIAPAAGRNRSQPMCIRRRTGCTASATVTTRSTSDAGAARGRHEVGGDRGDDEEDAPEPGSEPAR